jgi:hypothetical protein
MSAPWRSAPIVLLACPWAKTTAGSASDIDMKHLSIRNVNLPQPHPSPATVRGDELARAAHCRNLEAPAR